PISSSRAFRSCVSLPKGTILGEALRGDGEAYGVSRVRSDFSTVHPCMPSSDELIQSTSSFEVFFASPASGTSALRKPDRREGLSELGVDRSFCFFRIFQARAVEVVHSFEHSIVNNRSVCLRVVLQYDK